MQQCIIFKFKWEPWHSSFPLISLAGFVSMFSPSFVSSSSPRMCKWCCWYWLMMDVWVCMKNDIKIATKFICKQCSALLICIPWNALYIWHWIDKITIERYHHVDIFQRFKLQCQTDKSIRIRFKGVGTFHFRWKNAWKVTFCLVVAENSQLNQGMKGWGMPHKKCSNFEFKSSFRSLEVLTNLGLLTHYFSIRPIKSIYSSFQISFNLFEFDKALQKAAIPTTTTKCIWRQNEPFSQMVYIGIVLRLQYEIGQLYWLNVKNRQINRFIVQSV